MRDTQICISVVTPTTANAIEAMRIHASTADIFELRLDRIRQFDLPALLRARTKPVIVTYRPKREGGDYEGPEAARIAVLAQAAELGAEYIDVELDTIEDFPRTGSAQVIVSHHNFSETPGDIREQHSEMKSKGADIVKIVTTARTIHDSLDMLNLVRHADVPTIGLCMGEAGQLTRILAPKFGAALTFASASTGEESAPGQTTAAELLSTYRFRKVGAQTRVYGVVGNPVGHSMGPQIHNAAYDAAGIDAVYVRFPIVEPADLSRFLSRMAEFDVYGCSVTIPHKENVIASMSQVESVASKIGAVNTVSVTETGALRGDNTDWAAAVDPIAERLTGGLLDKRVVIVGAGGAARAIAFGVKARGGVPIVANRTLAKAKKLALEIDCEAVSLEHLGEVLKTADVLANTTRVGMHPDVNATLVPASLLREDLVVFDAVYNPEQTRLLRDAAAAGAPTVSGLEMFVRQAAEQFLIWTGKPAPKDVMRAAVVAALTA